MRGDVFQLPAPKGARGHEQQGDRFAVVVQSDTLPLSTVLVAPTTTGSFPAIFHPAVELNGARSLVLTEQTRAVDPARLGRYAGRLAAHELADLDRGLKIVFGLF